MELVLWLVGGLALAGFYSWINLCGIAEFGLGWAIRPGPPVFFSIVVLAALELRTMEVKRVIRLIVFLIAPLFLEFLSLPRPVDSFGGIALTLFGLSILFTNASRISTAGTLLLVITAYIQSVCIYNLFRGEQMMCFFRPGWTV